MDDDLNQMSHDDLISEIKKLRDGIRKHRDCSGHNLCWYHPDLWNLLPEKYDPEISVPDWPLFMEGCIHFRRSLDEQLPNALRTEEHFKETDSL